MVYIALEHFLPTLRKKPGALLGSRAWKLAEPALRSFHDAYFEGRTRVFIDLLIWAQDAQIQLEQLALAAAGLLKLRPHVSVDPDAVKAVARSKYGAVAGCGVGTNGSDRQPGSNPDHGTRGRALIGRDRWSRRQPVGRHSKPLFSTTKSPAMTTLKALHESVEDLSRQLRLPAFRQHYIPLAQAAAAAGQTHESYLLELLKVELDERIERRKKQRLRRCGLPYKRYLSELVREGVADRWPGKKSACWNDSTSSPPARMLSSPVTPGRARLTSPSAWQSRPVRRTSTSCSPAYHNCSPRSGKAGRRKSLRTLESRFEKYDLVVCDEFGYVSFDKGRRRTAPSRTCRCGPGRKSIIITTNLGFDRWTEIFGDAVLTAAMVDRLTHKSILVDMNGESYRLKETRGPQQQALQAQQQ